MTRITVVDEAGTTTTVPVLDAPACTHVDRIVVTSNDHVATTYQVELTRPDGTQGVEFYVTEHATGRVHHVVRMDGELVAREVSDPYRYGRFCAGWILRFTAHRYVPALVRD